MPVGGFFYYVLYRYMIFFLMLFKERERERDKKHAVPAGTFQVSTSNSSWSFLVFRYSSALKHPWYTCKTVHLSSVIFTRGGGGEKSLLSAAFLSSDFFGGGA